MNRLILYSRIGSDGVLHVTVPVGRADADREVRVTIEPAERPSTTAVEYSDWVRSVAGKWQGDWARPPQSSIEEREPLT